MVQGLSFVSYRRIFRGMTSLQETMWRSDSAGSLSILAADPKECQRESDECRKVDSVLTDETKDTSACLPRFERLNVEVNLQILMAS